MAESAYLNSQNFNSELINEGIMDMLGNIWPDSKRGLWSTVKEYIISWVIKTLGMDPNGWIASVVEVTLSNVAIVDVPKLFTDCHFLSDTLAKSLPEAIVKKMLNKFDMDNVFSSIMRNVFVEIINDTSFVTLLKEKLANEICQNMGKLQERMKGMVGQIQDKVSEIGRAHV